jgi:DNA-binding NtrC family response regulator
VLVADDDGFTRTHLADALARAGYEISIACDGRELLDHLSTAPDGHFHLVVTDERMPHFHGSEVVEMVGERSWFVIVTGSDDARLRERARELGVLDVLRKPIDVDAVIGWARSRCGEPDPA